jgi:LysM repeat protein
MPTQLQKAYLEVESGGRIDCMFNPSTFAFSTSNRWETDQIPGKPTPTLRFAGGGSGSFNLSLVFDTTADGSTVTAHTNKLLKLLDVDTSLAGYDAAKNNGRPPWVKFHWGTDLHSFKAVVTSASVTFTYFSAEGLPLRANVELALQQYEPDANWGPQNPTSGTPKPNRTHQVQVGDTLDRIAARYYGDSTKWRDIATLNGIGDPLDLTPGRLLSIPERSG